MKIDNVTITNWSELGSEWWERVKARPDEPLIKATFTLTLSWAEYTELLDRNDTTKEEASHE